MKIISILLLALVSFFYPRAQVIVNLQLPPEGLSIKPQLWNAVLTNTGNTSVTVKIGLSLTDRSNGEQVFSANSGSFLLSQGTTTISANSIMPIEYTLTNYSYNVDPSPDGPLPIGNFMICYEILQERGDAFDNVGEECEAIDILPLSPPYLNTPDNNVEIEETKPLFSWIPPAPLSNFANPTYTLKLVEVLQGQSSIDAIQQNIPILEQSNISQPMLQYPLTSIPLDTGKLYAWQIAVNSNNMPVTTSEVWSFRLKAPEVDHLISTSTSFVQLKRVNEIPFTVCSDYLNYQYTNETNDSLVSVTLTDITSRSLKIVISDDENESVLLGQNYKKMDLRPLKLQTGHIYLFQLTDSKEEKWFAKFEYKN